MTDQQGDTLGVIEHEINWCDTFECDGPAVEDPEYLGTCDDCGAELVRVKVVRADAYRGAVEAEADLQAIIDARAISRQAALNALADAIRRRAKAAARVAARGQ